jgi:hypothetical protein
MMYLHKEDLKRMLEILEQFPDAEAVEVKQDSSSGIGSITTMLITTKINSVEGRFEVEVSGVEHW